ncbi:MAG: hypothetical protein K6F23_02030 [Solobacterium sp.]|nr:hypothetical protein [Solobacterium sp.]
MANRNSLKMLNDLLQSTITADLERMTPKRNRPAVKQEPTLEEKKRAEEFKRRTEHPEPVKVTVAPSKTAKDVSELRKAVVMAEVLKEPVAYRRHRKRRSVRMV